MTFPGFHHRNRRRGHPAQLQRFLQVFGGQVVHGHKILVLVYLHWCTQLEPHRFLHRFAVSLAFGIFLCYTILRKQLRGFIALLGFEYRVSAFLINRTLRPSAPRIFGFHVGFAGGFYFCRLNVYNIIENLPVVCLDGGQNIGFIGIRPNHNFNFAAVECFCILVESRFSVNLICSPDDLIQICSHPQLVCVCRTIFPLQTLGIPRPDKFLTAFLTVQNRPSVPLKTVWIPFLDGLLHYGFPFFAGNTIQDIFIYFDVALPVGILLDRKTNIASFRRALCLEGSGVFFCTAQVVHGLLGVGKVFVLQNFPLILGQALGLQGRPVVGVKGQHFLGPADDAAQHLLHPVHHGADAPGPAAVLLGLPALELHPALEVRLGGEDAPPGIAHQLLGSFLIGQILLVIVGHLLPDHLVHGLKAAAPGQIQQGMVLQSLCSLAVQCVVPVVVLVQHRAERILCAVPKEDPGRLSVYISSHPAVCLSRTVLQHVLHHRRGAGCRRVQLDHLAASVIRIAQGPLVNGLAPARQALLGQVSTQLTLGPPGLCRILAVGVGDLQRVPALEVAQHIVHVGRHAAAGARQLQRLVKVLHVLHLAQPVQRRCCRRIAVTVHALRLFQTDLLRRLFAHLPAPQHLLRPGLLLALRPRCFHAVGLPHRAAVCFTQSTFFRGRRLHDRLLRNIYNAVVLRRLLSSTAFSVQLRAARHAKGSPFGRAGGALHRLRG